MQKVIIDTDPGHDDALAIMLAIKSNKFDVLAITTICGNSTIDNTTRNARYILGLLNKTDIPIYSGSEKPLKHDLIQAVVHGESGLEGIDPTNDASLTNNATDKILEIVKKYPNEVTIFTLGPLTNIAAAIKKDPDTMMLVKEIVMMGGAIRVPGNKNRVSEFNIFVDPDAAQIVFSFSLKKTLIPLDACNNVHLKEADFAAIENISLRESILKMIKPYISNIEKDTGINAALMYDPLTIFYLISPKSCTVKTYNIQIETEGEFTRGMTVADLRSVTDNLPHNCHVVENISEQDFKEYFIHTLSK